MAKVAIKSEKLSPFGGIFPIMRLFGDFCCVAPSFATVSLPF